VVTRRLSSLSAALLFLLVIVVALVWGARRGAKVEGCSPDEFDFGTVDAGSTLEFSARLLAKDSRGPLERLGIRLADWSPRSWEPKLRQWFAPPRPTVPFVPVDLKLLQPKVEAPDFVLVKEVTPRQEKVWYGGQPFVAVHGRCRIRMDRVVSPAWRVWMAAGKSSCSALRSGGTGWLSSRTPRPTPVSCKTS
jgi:hypothetical protein